MPAADTNLRFAVCPTSSFTSAFFPTTTPGPLSFFLWGAQFETGTNLHLLIPTTSAHVTLAGQVSQTNLTTAGDVQTFQQIAFATAPALNVPLTWTGSFFYRARFSEDKTDFKEFLTKIWSADKISLEQVLV